MKRNLTTNEVAFLIAMLPQVGNGYTSALAISYYLKDAYLWFSASKVTAALIGKYSRQQVAGFLSSLEEAGALVNDGSESSLTVEAIQYLLDNSLVF